MLVSTSYAVMGNPLAANGYGLAGGVLLAECMCAQLAEQLVLEQLNP